MDDFEAGDITNGTFKTRVLIATNDERVDVIRCHGCANVGVAAVNFFLRGHTRPRKSMLIHARRKFPRRPEHKLLPCSAASRSPLFHLRPRADRSTAHSSTFRCQSASSPKHPNPTRPSHALRTSQEPAGGRLQRF